MFLAVYHHNLLNPSTSAPGAEIIPLDQTYSEGETGGV